MNALEASTTPVAAGFSRISVTQALATVKQTTQLIATYFSVPRMLMGVVAGDKNISMHGGVTTEELTKKIQSDTDAIDQLHRKHFALKAAIAQSNAIAKVTILNKEYTVTEAVVLKNSLPQREAYLAVLRKALLTMTGEVDKAMAKHTARVDELIKASFPLETTDEQRSQIALRIRSEQDKDVAPKLFDPKNIKGKIDELEKEINVLKLELDYILSVSNTQTVIDVQL